MYNWVWVIIPVVAILGSFFLRYQKMKMKQLKQGTQEDKEEMQSLVNSLKKRIENLEAIAAVNPDETASQLEAEPERPDTKTTGGRPKTRGGKLENMLK